MMWLLCGGAMLPHEAVAQGALVAAWVQYAPGSTPAALAAGTWGNLPASLRPTVLVRAVVMDATSCPIAILDQSVRLHLNQRFIGSGLTSTPGTPGADNATPGYPQYFVSPTATAPAPNGRWGECEAVVPPGHTRIDVAGVTLKLPVAQPRRILVLADTGCRMKEQHQQNCKNPTAFPLQYLATMAASLHPDAILHIGDWFYRDTNCLAHGAEAFPGCNTLGNANDEPWGDTLESWNADVFTPAHALLAEAPWIMIRGNHESCGRGARGWFALLDPFPYQYSLVACAKTAAYPPPGKQTATYTGDFRPSYAVSLGSVNLLAHDSSFANDRPLDTNMAANDDIDLSNLLADVQKNSPGSFNIFTTHRAIFGLIHAKGATSCAGTTTDQDGNWTEQAMFDGGTGYARSAFTNGVPDSIFLFLSGHIHQFEYLNVAPAGGRRFPPQLIVGMGGSMLEHDCNTGRVPPGDASIAPFRQTNYPYLLHNDIGGTNGTLSDTYAHDAFGFAMLDAVLSPAGTITGYTAKIYTMSGAMAGACRITVYPRGLDCHL